MLTYSRTLEHLNPTPVHDEHCFDDAPLDAIYIDSEIYYLYWEELDGWERALRTYYDWQERRLRYRKTTRFYSGGEVIRQMNEFGGITISPSYYREHKRILYRTNALTQLNAFKYHSMSYRQLSEAAEQGELVTMKQHRSDKAKHALKIRSLRNADRARTRELLQGSALSTGLLNKKIDDIAAMLGSFKEQASKKETEFLTEFYSSTTQNLEEFLKEFFSKTERDYIFNNEHALVEISSYFNSLFNVNSTSIIKKLNAKQTANLMLDLI